MCFPKIWKCKKWSWKYLDSISNMFFLHANTHKSYPITSIIKFHLNLKSAWIRVNFTNIYNLWISKFLKYNFLKYYTQKYGNFTYNWQKIQLSLKNSAFLSHLFTLRIFNQHKFSWPENFLFSPKYKISLLLETHSLQILKYEKHFFLIIWEHSYNTSFLPYKHQVRTSNPYLCIT